MMRPIQCVFVSIADPDQIKKTVTRLVRNQNEYQGTKIFNIALVLLDQGLKNFYLSCKHMHLSFKHTGKCIRQSAGIYVYCR